jgi:predicted lipase
MRVLSFSKTNGFVAPMSPEERLDRLERVAKLLVTSGRRTRTELRTNINALIDAQMRNEATFNKQFARLSAAQAQTRVLLRELIVTQGRTEKKVEELAASHKELATAQKELAVAHKDLAVSQKELAVSQKQSDEKLSTLIDIVERDRNGKR